ncbi:hypothetical protein N7534_008718 [Penicillium rubens]|nr:hypothetical protein N7534_008718 [Penicillium rubens]
MHLGKCGAGNRGNVTSTIGRNRKIETKTYNSEDSLVVTHPTTNSPACGFCSISSRVGVARVSRRVTLLLICVSRLTRGECAIDGVSREGEYSARAVKTNARTSLS